jgi:hypothetical protein
MIFPRVLGLDSADVDDLPDDPKCCLVAVTARIGPSGGDAGDYFQFLVGTPAGLAKEEFSGWGTALLVVPEFSWGAVESALERLLAQCSAPTWEKVAEALSRYLMWEFENYQPAGG